MWALIALLAAPPEVHLEPAWQVPRIRQDRALAVPSDSWRYHPDAVVVGDALIHTAWTEQPVRPGDTPQRATTIARWVETGRERWQLPGQLQAHLPAGVVVHHEGVWRGIAADTGAELWALRPTWPPLPVAAPSWARAPEVWATRLGPDVLVFDNDFVFTRFLVVSPDTGQVRWSGVGWPQSAGSTLVLREGAATVTVVGRDRRTGEVRWRYETADVHPTVEPAAEVVWVATGRGARVVALDATTGTRLTEIFLNQHMVLHGPPRTWTLTLTPPLGDPAPAGVHFDAATRRLWATGPGAVDVRLDPATGAVVAWQPARYGEADTTGLPEALERLQPGLWAPFLTDGPVPVAAFDTAWVGFRRRAEPAPALPVIVEGTVGGHCVRPLGRDNVCRKLRVAIAGRVVAVDAACRFTWRGRRPALAPIQVVGVPGVPAEERWGPDPGDGRCTTPEVVPAHYGAPPGGRHTLHLQVVETASAADDPG